MFGAALGFLGTYTVARDSKQSLEVTEGGIPGTWEFTERRGHGTGRKERSKGGQNPRRLERKSSSQWRNSIHWGEREAQLQTRFSTVDKRLSGWENPLEGVLP